VIEFNCRFGDPEAEVILPLVKSGLTALLGAAARGESLPEIELHDAAAVTLVLAAAGYPQSASRGDVITMTEHLPAGVTVFHAGTSIDHDGTLVTSGGRVLAVTAVASTFEDALEQSRAAAEAISFEGKQMRRDIGWREMERRRTKS
jgi:phosphoribosylamine--glycine ligase